jgi:hypothetical protein
VPERIVLDIDDTEDDVHGGQQLALFNAHQYPESLDGETPLWPAPALQLPRSIGGAPDSRSSESGY